MSLTFEDSQLVVIPSGTRRQGRHRRIRLISESAPRRLIPHTWVQTNRILRRWSRDPATMFESLIIPLVLLVTLDIVLGNTISLVTGQDALYGSVPLVALVGAMSGGTIGGIGLMGERADGLLSRLWVLPVHRASGLLARPAADVVRTVTITAGVLCAGLVLGFRFRQGILESVAWLFIPACLGLAFSAIVITVALYAPKTIMVEAIEVLHAALWLFSTGFVPLGQYPRWLQPVVEHQPVSCAIDAMRGLALGGEVLTPLTKMLLWTAGIVALCAIPMMLGYRRASMRG